MAEGLLRHLAGDRFDVYSAGIDPTNEIHPCAVEAMEEVGIDISEQHPKGLRTYPTTRCWRGSARYATRSS
jgi:arsenate reductase (thioredoxin)